MYVLRAVKVPKKIIKGGYDLGMVKPNPGGGSSLVRVRLRGNFKREKGGRK